MAGEPGGGGQGKTCTACGANRSAGNVWYGRLPNKYCKKDDCYNAGVAAGHIIQRPPRAPGDAAAAAGAAA